MDGDAFFVGVEVAKNPDLKGKAVVTGEERGIVSALSYEAKALGVARGMSIFMVKKKFPQVIILPGDYASYVKYSRFMFDIVRRYADEVEEYSIDECFADLTLLQKTLKMTYQEMAERIKKEINDELKLSVSIGLAPTKVLAKVASKYVKPNGLTVIKKETTREYLQKTPISKVWGIGPKTADFLIKRGLKTAADFIDKDLTWVKQYLAKPYQIIWQELKGEYLLKLNPELKTVYSSMQKTHSFYPPSNDKVFLRSQFSKNIEEACGKARYYNLIPKKVSFFLKTQDFKILICSASLSFPSSAPEIIISELDKKFFEIYRRGVLYRTTGVILQDLISDSIKQQADLFGGNIQAGKFETVHRQIDRLEEKFGKKVIHLASTQKALKNKVSGTESSDLDRNLLFL